MLRRYSRHDLDAVIKARRRGAMDRRTVGKDPIAAIIAAGTHKAASL